VIVADTDVLIDYLGGVEPSASRVAEAIAAGRLYTTAIARAELRRGTRAAQQREALDDLLAALVVLPLDTAAADRAGDIARQLDASGQSIAMADALVAAITLVHGATLLTRNRPHFERVQGLKLEHLSSRDNAGTSR
jgi:predicted nucleic acid-binding protein